MKRLRGFTLIELMVSLTIGMIVLGAVVAVYVNSKRTFNVVNQRIAMQQDARIALLQISRDLRMAGSYGCATLDANNTAAAPAVTVDTSAVSSPAVYQTFITSGGSYLPFIAYASGMASSWLNGQTASASIDVLAVQYGRGTAQATAVASGGLATFSANSNMQRTYTVGQQFWVASTCQKIMLEKTPSGLASAGVSVNVGSMTSGADIMDLVSRAYFVNSSNALVMTELGQSGTLLGPNELISNVTGLQYEYGEVTDSVNCLVTYKNRASVANWRNVSSVRITLTVQSQNQVPLASGNSYGYLTQTYQTTAAIRGKQCYKSS